MVFVRRFMLLMLLVACWAPVLRAADDEASKKQAQEYFERGVALADQNAWDAALAEFLESRELYPTRNAAKNIGLCLRKLERFDEALDAYEALLQDFPTLPASDRRFAEQQVGELRALVGTITLNGVISGSRINIDGRQRGRAPTGALRVAAGTHFARVYFAGYAPFEVRFEVTGAHNTDVTVAQERLAQSGRVQITERSGRSADVLIDDVTVGRTPWDGPLAPGTHHVQLKGSGLLGTEPASIRVRADESVSMSLALERLESALRVQPTPASALVAIDGVSVGHGAWAGRLRAGAHRLEVAEEGFLPEVRRITLTKGSHETLGLTLERDLTSPLWGARRSGQVFFRLSAGLALSTTLGGDIATSCDNGCSQRIGIGPAGTFRGGYEFASGVGLGLDVGFLELRQSIVSRSTHLNPMGLPPNPGNVDDKLRLRGLLLGASAGLHRGDAFRWSVSLGAGVMLGSVRDDRSGSFRTVTTPVEYSVSDASVSSARYFYVDPEIALGYQLSRRVELGAALSGLIFVALTTPTWDSSRTTLAGNCAGVGCVKDGLAHFDAESLTGRSFWLILPSIYGRYDL